MPRPTVAFPRVLSLKRSGEPPRAVASRHGRWVCARGGARAAYYARPLLGRRDGDIAPYRHYTRALRPHPSPRSHGCVPRRATLVSRCGRARCLTATARGGSPPSRLAPRPPSCAPVPRCRSISLPRSITPSHRGAVPLRYGAMSPSRRRAIARGGSPPRCATLASRPHAALPRRAFSLVRPGGRTRCLPATTR